MEFLVYLIVMIVTLIISELTRPVPKGPKRPGIGDFQFPTADATRKIPMVWGKPLIRGPNVTWYGAIRTVKITKTLKGLFTSKKQTIGYQTYAGMHLAFCVGQGDVRLLKILVGDTEVWSGNLASGSGYIDQWGIFGGDESEGGIGGSFDWCPGGPAQGQNSYLRSQLGSRVPAYRSSARLVWRGGYLGNSKYIKEWAAQVQRLPNYLGSGYASINGHANPAEMLYEILTSTQNCLGEPPSRIDTTSFLAAAKTLHDEGLGMTLIWDGSKELEAIRADIQEHIDGQVFMDVTTNKWVLVLNREPSAEELTEAPRFDEKNANLELYSRPAADELVNEVYVDWTEDGTTSRWPAPARDPGMYQRQDQQIISVTRSYLGFCSFSVASMVAARDLRVLSYPLVKVTLKVDRTTGADKLRPLKRIKFSWAPLGIVEIVMTVIGIDYGTLDEPTIVLECVQDVYGLGTGLYVSGGNSGWVPPNRAPVAPTVYRMEFAPYWALQADPESTPDPEGAVPLLMVEAPNNSQMGYVVEYSDPTFPNAYLPDNEVQPYTPTADLAYDYPETPGADNSGTLIVRNLRTLFDLTAPTTDEIRSLGNGLLVIDQEWMAITSATAREDGSHMLTVQRGLLDSVITRHLAGAKVWFVSEGSGRTPTYLSPFQTGWYRAKLLSQAVGGQLPSSAAPLASVQSASTLQQRPRWAYPVRDLRINGTEVPLVVPNGNLVCTWRERNRSQEATIRFQTDTFEPVQEPGVRYRCYLYNSLGQLLLSSGDVTVPTYTFLSASLVGGLPTAGYVQVEAFLVGRGAGQRATIWFGLQVNYQGIVDQAPQRLIEEANPWTFWRMSD